MFLFVAYITRALIGSLWLNCRALFSRNAHGPITGLQNKPYLLPLFLLLVPYDKQLNSLDRSVVTRKSQTSAYRIDLAIVRSIRQGLSLRFSRNDLTLGYKVIIIPFDKKGHQWPGIDGGLTGLWGNRCCNKWRFRWSLHLHFDHIAGFGVDLQLIWCTIKEWPWWVRVSFQFNFYLLVYSWHILCLLHIMCGCQCDKAVNKNDTREVIWYNHFTEWNDIISLHGFELSNKIDCNNLAGPIGLHVIF